MHSIIARLVNDITSIDVSKRNIVCLQQWTLYSTRHDRLVMWPPEGSESICVGYNLFDNYLSTASLSRAKASTAPGMDVCEWSPQGLYDRSISWIPNTDEILILLKKNE